MSCYAFQHQILCSSCLQIRAIIGASLELLVEGVEVVPRILVPMVCTAHELEAVTALINKVAGQVTPLCCLAIRRQLWDHDFADQLVA
jgi:phosphoenolpyruvate-protein kinase (PTS system EI component)